MNIILNFHHISKQYNKIAIFDLEICEEENHFPTATLLIKAGEPLPTSETEGVIQDSLGNIHFKGLLMGAPSKIEGDFARIKLISKLCNFMESLENLQRESRTAPYWDPLWINPDKQNDFQEIQEVRTASLYCDRKTGCLSWSDWFEGSETLDLEDNIFEDSLLVKVKRQPLEACTVKVHVNWIQQERGVSNLASSLRKAFPHSRISTYTKNSLIQKWPEPGRRLGKSGVWVIKSDLKPYYPKLPFLPRFSRAITIGEDEETRISYRLERFWFKPILWVGWTYQQRRRETLTFTLPHSVQTLSPGPGRHKTLEFTLHNIYPDPNAYPWRHESYYHIDAKVIVKDLIYECVVDHFSSMRFNKDSEHWRFLRTFAAPLESPERSSFFLTERGQAAAEHAMERAKVELAKSARALEVTFEGPWEALKDITTNMSLTLADSRLPGERIKGKVTKWTFIAHGETGERFVRITLLCAIGENSILPQASESRTRQSPTGLRYFADETFEIPTREKGPLLRRIQLMNGPEDQEESLQNRHYETPKALQEALEKKATRLRLFFRDLRTKHCLEQMISFTMLPWSAPKQVDFTSNRGI
ncbi:MAG: hypothetical protein K2X28_03435 [Alphaproteobacteria bacterium]|nr:hypothetical protein [Alphaproteobacteria bacterium]